MHFKRALALCVHFHHLYCTEIEMDRFDGARENALKVHKLPDWGPASLHSSSVPRLHTYQL